MKNLKLWQKAGLVAAIVSGLTLGGLTPKYDSKGLESKLPTMGVSVAEAKETNPNGYEVPDLTGYKFVREIDYDASEKVPGKETKVQLWKNNEGDNILVYKFKDETYCYSYIKKDKKNGYSILANKQKNVYDEKYSLDERIDIPDRLV